MDQTFSIEETTLSQGAKIVAIGVGGGGGNMIAHMISEGVSGIKMVMANTDAQALETSLPVTKIQLGARLTKGLGAGMKPSVGKDSAIESYDDVRAALEGADIVFIAAGLGGGTGTGAAPIIAQIAKESGALTISVVTKPFDFEGKKRTKLANDGLEDLKQESDSIIVIPNQKLLSTVEKGIGLKAAFKLVDSILSQAVSGTSEVILASSNSDINLDFADVKTIISHPGLALLGVGEYQGENAAYEAIRCAVESPLLDNVSIDGAMGVLVHFTMHPDFSIIEINESMNVIHESAHDDADIIFGTTCNNSLSPDYVKITLIATGFEKSKQEAKLSANNEITAPTGSVKSSYAQTKQIAVNDHLSVEEEYNEEYLEVPTYIRLQKD